jgi:hypothetical protein
MQLDQDPSHTRLELLLRKTGLPLAIVVLLIAVTEIIVVLHRGAGLH